MRLRSITAIAIVLGLSAICSAAYAITLEEAVSLALSNGHRLKQHELQSESARDGVGVARAQFFPKLDLAYGYTKSSELAYGPEDELSTFTMQASVNVFNGFSDLNSLFEAKDKSSAADYRRRSERANTVLAAKTAYTDLLRAKHAVLTAQEGVSLLERQRQDAELFFQEGLIAKNALLKVEVELASSRQELLEAQGALATSRHRLSKTIGKDIIEDEVIADYEVLPKALEITFEAMRDEMLQGRSDINYLRAMRDAYRHASYSVSGGHLPRIDVAVSRTQYGDTTTPSGRDYTYDEEDKAMVTASWRIFDGLRTTNSASQLKYLSRAANEEILEAEAELVLQLRRAVEDYRIAEGKLEVGRAAVGQAEENYRVTELQFKERVATTTDLLDAQRYLARAKNQYYRALYDLHTASDSIERILGRTEQ